MRARLLPRCIVSVAVVVSAVLFVPNLHASWSFGLSQSKISGDTWGVLKGQGYDWPLSLFDIGGYNGTLALGVDDDCDGLMEIIVVLAAKHGDEGVLDKIPKKEGVLYGGLATEKGWSGVLMGPNLEDPFSSILELIGGDGLPPPDINASIVVDLGDPTIDKSTPGFHKALGFSMAASQLWTTRFEWDFDGDGIRDRIVYWGQNRPVLPPTNFRDSIIVVGADGNPCYMLVAGTPPETLMAGGIIVPNSNMGFKLNLAAIEEPGGPGLFSNMGFKLNYSFWQGGNYDPEAEIWWGKCDAWFSSGWILVPEPDSATKKIIGRCDYQSAGVYDIEVKGISGMKFVDKSTPQLYECDISTSGIAAIFIASGGWSCVPGSSTLSGVGPAAFAIADGDAALQAQLEEQKNGAGGTYDAILNITCDKGYGFVETANWGSGIELLPWSWDYKENSWLGLLTGMDKKQGLFVRGEANLDSTKGPDISDAIAILNWLFLGGKELRCVDAADVNDDGAVDISDGVALLSFLFLGGHAPREPFPQAGPDPTPDSLGCDLMR
jgi:hypothetical protein